MQPQATYGDEGDGVRQHRLVADPESFLVAHTEGPLLDGELDRAARWADTVANELITAAPIDR